MTYLITGASGFVGCTLVETLAARGADVLATDVIVPPPTFVTHVDSLPGSVTFARLDVTRPESIADALEGRTISRVVHAAAITAGPDREAAEPERIIAVNVAGTANLLQALRDQPIRRFVQVSSSAAYGETVFATDLIEEDMPSDPVAMYDITKMAAERVALRLGDLAGIDVRIGRLSTVFGAWEWASGVNDFPSPMFLLLDAAERGGTAVLPRPVRRDWLYSRDAAAGLIAIADMADAHIADAETPAVFNVGPGPDRAWTVLDWGRKLAAKWPDFRCRVAEPGEAATIDLHQARDRAPMAIDRILTHTDYRPRFTLDRAFEDFWQWQAMFGRVASG